ncbi:MAG: DUF4835 family protein [Flavobacterium sp.]|nr:DUF4835 family protein [Flavobacterium sp.]
MYKKLILALLFVVGSTNAQELNCTVKVNFEQVASTNNQVFKTLETSLSDFVNKTNWTSQKVKNVERINCSMFITINEYLTNQFKATIQVGSSRPIFNSSYSSPVLNYNDKDFNFEYNEFQQFNYNPNSFDSNLVSVVAFYSLVIIGMDADSYKLDGGIPYYEAAQEIANVAQSSGYKGWLQGDTNQNRYWLVNNLLSNTFTQFREALYSYHLEGMDQMHQDQKVAKGKIIEAVTKLSYMELNRPNSFLTRVFFDAKSDEIVSIFTGGPTVDTADLVNKLYTISPMNASKWSEIKM